LQINSYTSKIFFDVYGGNAAKFVLFHHQNQQSGFLVDISSMAGSFLCMDSDDYVAAISRTPPANKFLIIPVGVQ
jgi:hypothetical protein